MAPADISKITIDSLTHAPTPTPTPTPVTTPTPTPTPTPNHSPTPSPTPSSSPEKTEPQPESESFPTASVVAGIASAIVVCIGLLIYFKKRKH